ncbi:MAG: hypothetical protein JW902_14715 [Syntrophaceae bacterium]|nr:hypothetical protein [Syntrophaceae bacterium]
MVRPIDAQQSILQSSPMEKVQQVQQQHTDMQQRYFKLQLTEERRLQKEKVKDLEQKETTAIRDSFEREQNKREMRDQNDNKDENVPSFEENLDDEPPPGMHIDIKA